MSLFPITLSIRNGYLVSRVAVTNTYKEIDSLGNSSCKHLFTLPEDPVVVRKIKPPRAQRGTERCYSPLSPPPCPPWFFEPNFENVKKSLEFWSVQREIPETHNLQHPAQRRGVLKRLHAKRIIRVQSVARSTIAAWAGTGSRFTRF